MARQFSVAVRNSMLNGYETAIGASPVLKMFTGAPPANCAAANTGTELVSMDLPADFMAAAADGSKAMSGTWSDPAAGAAGNIGHFRLYANDGTTCHDQGTVTATGGGGDMTVQNINVAVGQLVTITSFTLNAGNS